MPSSPLSVQLYTVRDALAADLPGTLARLAEIGFREVEPFGLVEFADHLEEALPAHGLTAPSAHTSLLGDADLDAVFAAAARTGVTTVIEPYADPARWTTREGVAGVARDLAEVARRAADHGLRVGYHNHHFELETRVDGVPALEVFADLADPSVVLEVDTYWATVGGVDPVGLLERLGERVQLLHVKDGPGTADTKAQVAVGSGSLPVQQILDAAPQALPVVELDDTEGDVVEAVAQSHRFLTTAVTR